MNGKTYTVLVAEDIGYTRKILCLLLKKEYNTLEAADGAGAIEQLEAHADDISCVLLDIKMPGIDGFGVLEYMRCKNLLRRIPVIALTSITEPESLRRCFEGGVVDLIKKPYQDEILLATLRRNLERFHGRGQGPAAVRRTIAEQCRVKFGITDENEIREVERGFLKAFGDCAHRLESLPENPDFAEVRDVTHDIRGFAASAGADDLVALNEALNTAAKAANRQETDEGIRRIIDLYKEYMNSEER